MSRSARRASPWIIALLAATLAVAPSGMVPAVAAATSTSDQPIVTVVVGPTHDLTDQYLAWGEQIAQRAAGVGADVRRVFYPDATWSNVVQAAQGANVFIYLGHGNGYPSPYTSSLMMDRQDGLGLDPAAGDAEDVVQYYGEKYVAADLHFAPHAVVILNHLCYASGNSEPGYPDPTVSVAEQRVDNFAAGFLAAGAAGVFALGHEDASDILAGLFGPPQTLDQLFMSVGYTGRYDLRFSSTRTPGTTAHLDPEAPGAYFRSVAGYLDTPTSSVIPVGVSGAGTAPTGATGATAGLPATQPQPGVPGATAPVPTPDSSAPGSTAVPLRLSAVHAAIVVGQSDVLTAQVDPVVDGQSALFQQRPSGATGWTDVARLAVEPDGSASLVVAPQVNTEYRVQSERVPGQASNQSVPLRVLVRQRVVLRPSKAGASLDAGLGASMQFSAAVQPAASWPKGDVTFVVARLSGGRWVTAAVRSVRVGASGSAVLAWRFPTRGSWSVRASARPTPENANSYWTAVQRISVR